MASFYRNTVFKIFEKFEHGSLELHLPDGDIIHFERTEEITATIVIHDESFFKQTLLNGDIGFGESYVEGHWDSPDVVALISWFLLNYNSLPDVSPGFFKKTAWRLLRLQDWLQHRLRRNTRSGSSRNIEAHYDLGNDFYELFLDNSMTYSSAFYTQTYVIRKGSV